MSPEEILAAAIALGLPDLIKLIQSLVANAQGQGASLETLTASANTAADVAETLARGSAPALLRVATLIGARFGIVVSEKTLAQAVPLVGAGAGAALNAAFTEHFNTVARLHFGLRRLERAHGEAAVRLAYGEALAQGQKSPA